MYHKVNSRPFTLNIFVYDLFQLNSPGVEIYLYAEDAAIILSAANNELLQITITNFLNNIASGVMLMRLRLTLINLTIYRIMVLMLS